MNRQGAGPARKQVTNRAPDATVSFAVVIVLYKQLPSDSVSVRTLLHAAMQLSASTRFHIHIFDNTPGGQDPGVLPGNASYHAAPSNPGLAVAYNSALRSAVEAGFQWLLTLDQDTDLPVDFLHRLTQQAAFHDADPQIAAIVPHITDNGRPISPLRFTGGFWPQIVPLSFSGAGRPFTSAINSGSLLRVSALQTIGGYDESFPLNNSDTTLFHRLGQAGFSVVVLDQPVVKHELAIMDRENRMTPERYKQLLADERACWDMYMGFWGRVERWLRLLARWTLDTARGADGSFRAASLEELKLRLLTKRRTRIETWQKTALLRALGRNKDRS